MTNVLCVRAQQVLTGPDCPNWPSLGPPHAPPPMPPRALFKLSSGLWVLVCSVLLKCLSAAPSWLCLAVAPSDLALALQAVFPAWFWTCLIAVDLPGNHKTASDPGYPHQSWSWFDFSAWPHHQGLPWCGCLAEAGCHPGPALLTLLRYCGTRLWLARSQPCQPCYRFQPRIPQGAASPVISNTWKLDKCSSGCFTVHFLFLDSGEIERVGY